MPLSFQARITVHVEESVFMLEVFLFADKDMSTTFAMVTLCQSSMQNQTCSQVSVDWALVACVQ
jgi:hypothetical protein